MSFPPTARLLIGFLLPFALLASPARAEVVRHALVVGVNDGGMSLEPLKYAEQDARRFADILVELGDFDPEAITVLYSPDRERFLLALDAHAQVSSTTAEDLFIFYYSGHADARGLRLGTEVVRYETLREHIRSLESEVRVGVLDACRSGAIARLKGARVTTPFLAEDDLAAEGEAWLTASTADESAQESDQIRGSFFTHYLLSGLRGAADQDDGLVSLDEAYRYAYQRTVARTGGTEGGTQHPVYDFRLQGEGELILTDVRKGMARVSLPEEVAGEITVLRLPDRVPVAEVAKPMGDEVSLALAPGRYLFRLRGEAGIQETTVGLAEGSHITVARFGARRVPEVSQLKGLNSLSATLQELAVGSQATIDSLQLHRSPFLASAASAIVPGAGQAYNGQWVKGGFYFLGTAAFLGGGLIWRGTEPVHASGALTGANFATFLGCTLYGLSIADAAWHAREQSSFRPRKGLVITTETAWRIDGGDAAEDDEDAEIWPHDTGFAADWIVDRGFSIGLDRTGTLLDREGNRTFGIGSRMMVGADGDRRFRPGAFVALGMRSGEDSPARVVAGAGANLRWYLTPRYLVQIELRQEVDGGESALVMGAGLGTHLFH